MIVSKPLVAKVLAGEKTAHLQPVRGDERRVPAVGDLVAVHVAVGRRSTCRVEVTAVDRVRLGELGDITARWLGLDDLDAVMTWWVQTHDVWNEQAAAWLIRFRLDHQPALRQTTDGAPWTDDEAPLVDATWETEEAGRRHDAHQAALGDLDARRRQHRERLSVGQRLDRVIGEAGAMSTAPGRSYGPRVTSSGADGSVNLAGSPLGEQSDVVDVDRHLFVILKRVEELEREVDVARGVAPALRDASGVSPGGSGRRLMAQEVYDRLLTAPECIGRRPEELAEAMPYLGSPRTIRRRRAELQLRGVDGTPVEQRRGAA